MDLLHNKYFNTIIRNAPLLEYSVSSELKQKTKYSGITSTDKNDRNFDIELNVIPVISSRITQCFKIDEIFIRFSRVLRRCH